MSESEKSKGRLVEELEGLRWRIAELEASEARLKVTSVMAKENEDRYQTILERLEEGYYELDRKGNLISFNESLCRMFGYPRDELLGMNYRLYQTPETVERMQRIARQIYRGGKPVKILDYEIIRKDGRTRILELSASPLRDASGLQMGICGIARDVTKRKEAEKMLRESERRLSEIINFLPDATFAIDMEGRVMAWNQAMEKMVSILAEDIIGKGDCEYALPLYGLRRPCLVDLVFKENPATEEGYTVFRRDQTSLLAESSVTLADDRKLILWEKAGPIFDDEGRPIGAIESLRDITPQRTAENMLRASEEKYRNLLESIDEGYFEIDLSGNFTLINDTVCKVFKYSRDELLGMNHRRYSSAEGARNVSQIFSEIFNTGKPATGIDFDIVRKDGALRILSVSASLALDSSCAPMGFRGVLRDVTDRRRMERELEKRERELAIQSRNLAEANIALKVLLTKREEDKILLEQDVMSNVHQLVIPFMERLGQSNLDSAQLACVRTLKSNLENIVSPFLRNIGLDHFNLTPQEIHIANQVKDGRTTKEIAALLNLSSRTVEFHRANLRMKLDLKNKKSNLRSYLLSIS